MGKKGGLFSAVKRALRHSDSKKGKRSRKSISRIPCFGYLGSDLSKSEAASKNPPPHYPPIEETKLIEPKNELIEQAYSVAYPTIMAAPASRFLGKSKEEIAAIKIQTAYRGYMARRATRPLRGLGRLKSLIQSQSVRRQGTSALRCLQMSARVQAQVRSRRIRMSEENLALQRQLLQKQKKELKNIRSSMGSSWDSRTKSKEQVEANLQSKKEAAERRERALAYAYTHQQTWRNSSKSMNPTFMDPNNPHWGWSWLERWMAVRPWETQITTDKESVGDSGRRVRRQSPSTPPSKRVSSGRLRSASSKGSIDNDSKSLSGRSRGSSVCDHESMVFSPTARSSTGSTKSIKVSSRLSKPGPSPLGSGKKGTPGPGSAKNRIVLSGSPSSGIKKSSNLVRTNNNIRQVNPSKGA